MDKVNDKDFIPSLSDIKEAVDKVFESNKGINVKDLIETVINKYVEPKSMLKLHLGCGKRDFGPDWIHIDGEDYSHVSSHDVTKLPFEDKSVDLIYACHLIAYFDQEEIIPVLQEWKRVLKPGGVLRVATPDFWNIVEMYSSDYMYTDSHQQLNNFLGPLYGKMNMGNKMIYHKTAYDYQSLVGILKVVGFKNIYHYDWRKTEHAHFDDHSQAYIPHMDKENGTLISLNVECNA